jgi:hypothetical protein
MKAIHCVKKRGLQKVEKGEYFVVLRKLQEMVLKWDNSDSVEMDLLNSHEHLQK